MLSEGQLRAERMRKAIKDLASNRDEPALSLFEVAYLLVASMIYRDLASDGRLSRVIGDLLDVTHDRGDAVQILQALADEISHIAGSSEHHVFPSQNISWRSIIEVADLVDRGIRELGPDGLRQVLDTLFYELFTHFSPSSRAHHATVAHLTLPLIRQFGGVVEVEPGPGELLITSGTDTYESVADDSLQLPGERVSRLRFLRRIRFAAHGLHDTNRGMVTRSPTLAVMDRTLFFTRGIDDARLRRSFSGSIKENVQRLRMHDGAVLIILSHKERSQLERMRNDPRWLVENLHLRAVIAFPSFAEMGKPTERTALYFHSCPFPGHENEIAFIDVRQLHPALRKDELQHCTAIAGVLIRSWYDDHPPSEEALELTRAPRRVLAFVGEGLRQTAGSSVQGFFRFASLDEVRDRGYSFRVENYVERRTDNVWRPKVQIAPLLRRLRDGGSNVSIYLIGDNGAGKSLALADIAMSLAQNGRHSVGVSFGTTDRFDLSPSVEPLKSFFTYSGARTSKAGTAHKIAMGKLGNMVKSIYQSQHRLACFENALGIIGFEPRQYLVRMAARSTADPLDLLLAEVHELTRHDASSAQGQPAAWQFLENGEYKIAVVRRNSGEVVVFDSLSSGEQQVLTMIIKIVSDLNPETTVLLDEPEISLHVAWQRQLPQVLRIFADGLKCSFVVATHSPIVISSATDACDHCFTMEKGSLSEIMPADRRSVEASLFEGFNIYTPHTHHIQERCAEIVSSVLAKGDNPMDPGGAMSSPDIERHPQVQALLSLQHRLTNVQGEGHEQDAALIKSAIAAVKEVLTP